MVRQVKKLFQSPIQRGTLIGAEKTAETAEKTETKGFNPLFSGEL